MRKYFLELFAIGLVDSEGRINTEHMTSDALMTAMKTMEELLIDRREKSKSLAWSSVVLAFENSKRISEEVKKPKALGDIRGVSYIYPILWRFGLIRVPEAIEKNMGKQR